MFDQISNKTTGNKIHKEKIETQKLVLISFKPWTASPIQKAPSPGQLDAGSVSGPGKYSLGLELTFHSPLGNIQALDLFQLSR